MEARASSRFVRLTAQKARLVVGLIRGKKVESAIAVLEYTPKRGAKTVLIRPAPVAGATIAPAAGTGVAAARSSRM